MILPVGLGHGQIELALADSVQVVDGATGALNGATDTMFFTVHVHQTTDRTAGRIINTGYTTGADSHKALLLRGNGGGSSTQADCGSDSKCGGFQFQCHVSSSFFLFIVIPC